jgi:hypothetical protein
LTAGPLNPGGGGLNLKGADLSCRIRPLSCQLEPQTGRLGRFNTVFTFFYKVLSACAVKPKNLTAGRIAKEAGTENRG